jgi:hypothetical protein
LTGNAAAFGTGRTAAAGRPVPPPGDVVTVQTVRNDGTRQTFAFAPRGDFLEATAELPEPHQFAATLSIGHHDDAHSYETRFIEPDHGLTHGHDHEHDQLAPRMRTIRTPMNAPMPRRSAGASAGAP